MKNKRNILWAVISCSGALAVVSTVLFVTGIIKVWLFLGLLGVSVAVVCVCVFLISKLLKKIKLSQISKQKANVSSGNYMLDIYNLLGVAPQYNKDGTLKSIYEILQIKPIYDENGNRVYTVYELLGLAPLIGADGKEIPRVFAIKNRVGRIAKVSLSTAFLTRKLSPEEEEQKLIRETLEKKLEEAEKAGDNKKAGAIKKAIKAQEKKPAKAKKSEKSVSYSNSKNGKFVSVKISDPNAEEKKKKKKKKKEDKKDDGKGKDKPADKPAENQAPPAQPSSNSSSSSNPPKVEPAIKDPSKTENANEKKKKSGGIYVKAWEGRPEDAVEEQLEQ